MLLYITSNSKAIKGKMDNLVTFSYIKNFKFHLGNNIINKVKKQKRDWGNICNIYLRQRANFFYSPIVLVLI